MNRLAGETSPYLRQHRDNPVDWYPWGEEALRRAPRELDRPLFVSIGYSACHWCHVMAHESFEDEATAAILNERFVAVKVDREERPDVDAIYMEAVQALTGSGGWPLSVFLDARRPPVLRRHLLPEAPDAAACRRSPRSSTRSRPPGRPAAASCSSRPSELTDGDRPTASAPPPAASDRLRRAPSSLDGFVGRFGELFDPEYGGIGAAPKFPQPPMLELLLARRRRRATIAALRRCSRRRSRRWPRAGSTTTSAVASPATRSTAPGTVPHFEKMLYDQAAWPGSTCTPTQLTGDERWRQVATETLDYVLRDLALRRRRVRSAEDADSEGEEGRFYIWTAERVRRGRSGRAPATAPATGTAIDGAPNFEDGRSILAPRRSAATRPPAGDRGGRAALFAARERTRVRPGLDDKVLTEWNAMTISALAEAAAALGERALRRRGDRASASSSSARCAAPDGRWLRSYQGGRAAAPRRRSPTTPGWSTASPASARRPATARGSTRRRGAPTA